MRLSNYGEPGFYSLAVAATLFTCLGIARSASAQTQVAVEYYYAAWDYYFRNVIFPTRLQSSTAVLSVAFGSGLGRRSTFGRNRFQGHRLPADSSAHRSRRRAHTSTTPFASECATVKNNPNWQYEAIAFYLQLPGVAGTCAAGTTVLYRLYNNGMGVRRTTATRRTRRLPARCAPQDGFSRGMA